MIEIITEALILTSLVFSLLAAFAFIAIYFTREQND